MVSVGVGTVVGSHGVLHKFLVKLNWTNSTFVSLALPFSFPLIALCG